MAKKLTVEEESTLKGRLECLTVQQQYELLQTVSHPRMKHVENVHILDNGTYSFSEGTDLKVHQSLDPEKDSKIIRETGKKSRMVTLPGKYVNRKKVVDIIPVEDIIAESDSIKTAYSEHLSLERKKAKDAMLSNPDATAEMLSEMLNNKGGNSEKMLQEIKDLLVPKK